LDNTPITARIESSILWAARTDQRDDILIIVDVLRACTTICILLSNGAKEVRSVDLNIKTFLPLRRRNRNVIFVGERNRVKLPGADLTNSPWECLNNKTLFHSKSVIFSSTDFSNVLDWAERHNAQHILLGCVVNAKHVAEAAVDLAREAKRDICIVECGDPEDEDATVDNIGSTVIARSLQEMGCRVEGQVDRRIQKIRSKDILALVSQSVQAAILRSLGFAEDVRICCELNKINIVPRLAEGAITSFNRGLRRLTKNPKKRRL